MTEGMWRSSTDPELMLESLRGNVSERKLRLFVLACCRRLWGDSSDEATLVALESAECFAERRAQAKKSYVRVRGGQAVLDCGASEPVGPLLVMKQDGSQKQVSSSAISPNLVAILEQLACGNIMTVHSGWQVHILERSGLPAAEQVELLRDVIRGPLRPLHFRAAWRTDNGGMSLRVAQTIYDERAFEQLPILADALYDAGCDNDEILDHLRGPGEHVRGCWVVDLLLNKS